MNYGSRQALGSEPASAPGMLGKPKARRTVLCRAPTEPGARVEVYAWDSARRRAGPQGEGKIRKRGFLPSMPLLSYPVHPPDSHVYLLSSTSPLITDPSLREPHRRCSTVLSLIPHLSEALLPSCLSIAWVPTLNTWISSFPYLSPTPASFSFCLFFLDRVLLCGSDWV